MTLDARWSTCALCPRLCRTACPVATGAAREAAVPSFIAALLGAWEAGTATDAEAREVATLCTDCGACQERCHIDRPLPAFLAEVRGRLLAPPEIAPLERIEGDAPIVAIEADDRPMALVLGELLAQPVARWRTRDRLGVSAREHPVWSVRAAAIREAVGTRRLVVADGGVAEALTAASVGFEWLHDVTRANQPGAGSCRSGGRRPLACCGGAGPLLAHHPEDALRVGRLWLERADEWRVVDARCREHLTRCGGSPSDVLDELLAQRSLTSPPAPPRENAGR